MNNSAKHNIKELINRFDVSNRAASKSPRTTEWYNDMLNSLNNYLNTFHQCNDLAMFNRDMIREYIIYLQHKKKYEGHPYTPTQPQPLSPRTIQCHVRALKAFSTWLCEEKYTGDNRLSSLKMPKAPAKLIEPLSPQEIDTITSVINQSTPQSKRDYAIFATMLDSGLRVSEVCGIILDNLNLSQGSIRVMGKGWKERTVPVGRFVTGLLCHYIDCERPRLNGKESNYLFLSKDGNPVTANALKLMFSRLAKKSGVTRLHAHLCRHTFAVNYLLNGGDIFSLREILGHTTLEMVNHYLHFTKAQISEQHRKYSPMDKFCLTRGDRNR